MIKISSNTTYEDKEIRCPKLGGPVSFGYCRIENNQQPCQRAIGCWSLYFDAESYFKENLSPEEFTACFSQPTKHRVATLIDLIEQAKKTIQDKKAEGDTGPNE